MPTYIPTTVQQVLGKKVTDPSKATAPGVLKTSTNTPKVTSPASGMPEFRAGERQPPAPVGSALGPGMSGNGMSGSPMDVGVPEAARPWNPNFAKDDWSTGGLNVDQGYMSTPFWNGPGGQALPAWQGFGQNFSGFANTQAGRLAAMGDYWRLTQPWDYPNIGGGFRPPKPGMGGLSQGELAAMGQWWRLPQSYPRPTNAGGGGGGAGAGGGGAAPGAGGPAADAGGGGGGGYPTWGGGGGGGGGGSFWPDWGGGGGAGGALGPGGVPPVTWRF